MGASGLQTWTIIVPALVCRRQDWTSCSSLTMSSSQIIKNEEHTKVFSQRCRSCLSGRAGHRRSQALAIDKVSVVAHLCGWGGGAGDDVS